MNVQQPSKLPFLEFLGWQIADVYCLTQLEMLASSERGGRCGLLAKQVMRFSRLCK